MSLFFHDRIIMDKNEFHLHRYVMDWGDLLFVLAILVLIVCIILAARTGLELVIKAFSEKEPGSIVGAGQGSGLHTLRMSAQNKPSRGTVLLIPGLGNGVESYNWNLSSADQRTKSKIEGFTTSLQNKITEAGFDTISFDAPGYGSNLDVGATTVKDYIALLRELSPDVTLVVGHSIGARIAQLYGNKYNCPYIMLDPTPDYIIETVNYRKHLTDPTNVGFQKTHEFLQMISAGLDDIRSAKWAPKTVIISLDDEDPGREKKEKYFDALATQMGSGELVKHLNATHWVHVTRGETVLAAIEK